jgi:hypothetical protein
MREKNEREGRWCFWKKRKREEEDEERRLKRRGESVIKLAILVFTWAFLSMGN